MENYTYTYQTSSPIVNIISLAIAVLSIIGM